MKVLFYTFPGGHLVSDKEFERLKHGFAKRGMELIRWHVQREKPPEHDVVMVKGWSHRYAEVHEQTKKPLVYYSIGTEWKVGEDLAELNEPVRELYEKADKVVHVSDYCLHSHRAVFGADLATVNREGVIIPACEPNLSSKIPLVPGSPLKLATTCIPRPVKRIEETERLCKREGIELVTAYGSVDDFSYYHEVDGYIHLSRKEGMPNTVLEALSYGLPCIVTNYGGAKEAVGDAGIVIHTDPASGAWDPNNIEPVDNELFRKAIWDFRDNYKELHYKTRERVRSELNDYITASQFVGVFKKILL